MTLYHYDRSGLLESGARLDLSKDYGAIEKRSPGSESLLRDLFPDGLSQYGLTYMQIHVQFGLFCDVVQARMAFGQFSSNMQEQTLELARRAFFPERPSRLQSIFCLPDAEGISDWPELITGDGKLFEIESFSGSFAGLDSKWLRGGISVLDDGFIARSTPLEIDLARKYWSGSLSGDPRLEVLVELPVTLGKVVEIGCRT